MIPFAPTAYNPYWQQWGADGYMASNGSVVPYVGYGPGPCDTSFGAMMPSDMYAAQGYMQGFVPPVQRDYTDYGMGTHNSGHVMSREEFEARKADLRKKREQEQWYNSRDQSRDMLGNGGDIILPKHKMRVSSLAPATLAREDRGMSTERHRESEPSHLSPKAQAKRKADRDDFQMKDGRYSTDGKLDSQVISDVEGNKTIKPGFVGRMDKKQKGSVFSRISFPEDVHIGQVKKRNVSSHDATNGFREHESTVRVLNGSKAHFDDGNPVKRIVNGRRYMYDDELSDSEQNFKRKATSHRREISEEWDDDKYPDSSGRTSKNLRDRIHQNKI